MDAPTSVVKTKKKTKKILTLNQAEEKHLLAASTSTTVKKISETKGISKMSKKKSEDQTNTIILAENNTSDAVSIIKNTTKIISTNSEEWKTTSKEEHQQNGDTKSDCDGAKVDNNMTKKKTKAKKNKKESDKQNISVKSSFSKFDALQKRNLIHNPQGEIQTNCRLCDKPVYKMEEVKAEKSIYHKNCFRCRECNKQLKVDTYQSHEGVLYCTIHFKLLFAPKLVEEDESVKPRKPELIIRENQPTELPPDVVRASDKPNLGLEELQQLNVRSRFQVFEHGSNGNESEELHQLELTRSATNPVVKRSASILSKVSKLQQLGSSTISQDTTDTSDNDEDVDSNSDNPNSEFVRQKKRDMQKRERPVGLGEAMNDIRTLFEKGHGITKEERREERKQEIQNIRSRLFMGKQARIKEMYQQAVADSEQAITAADKKPDISIEVDSRSLRERFEKGEAFMENKSVDDEDGESSKRGAIEKEADVFESAISKKSRSIFMELDANVVNGKNQNILPPQPTNKHLQHQKSISSIYPYNADCEQEHATTKNIENDVIKCGEAIEDVQIQTSEISEKFKFFETYHPTENKKPVFRITPPRDGVVKMPSPDENSNEDDLKDLSPDRHVIAHSRTTSMMLNKFRELENNPHRNSDDSPKPLKCFTPPPDGNRRIYDDQESDEYESNEDDDEDESEVDENDDEDDYYNCSHSFKDDKSLIEAQNAARAKQLRVKFEKWQANEINHENNQDRINIYSNNVSDDNSIESTKSIRERFEKMRNIEKSPQPTRPRHQVNRFV